MSTTVIKYSTARSGLLKLALKARITCSRSNPISIMLLIVDWSASPLKKLPSAVTGAGAVAEAGAGAGVAAGGDDTTGAGDWAGGAAGAAGSGWGVDVDAAAGGGWAAAALG